MQVFLGEITQNGPLAPETELGIESDRIGGVYGSTHSVNDTHKTTVVVGLHNGFASFHGMTPLVERFYFVPTVALS